MTTPAKIAANRRNALLSTGPTTAAGIAVAKMNAVRHGLRTAAPVIPGETAGDWEAFRDGVVADLAPVGVLETELADRVAVLSWRLRRATAFEAGVVAAACERAVLKVHFPSSLDRMLENDFDGKLAEMLAKTRGVGTVQDELDAAEKEAAKFARRAELLDRWPTLADADPLTGAEAAELLEEVGYQGPMREDEFFDLEDWELLEAAGVPEEWREEPAGWGGWTAGHVRGGMAHLVALHITDVGDPLDVRLGRIGRETAKQKGQWAAKVEQLRAELARLEATVAEREAEARRKVLLPTAEQSDRVMKYENHIQRQLVQCLHQLERMRAASVPRSPSRGTSRANRPPRRLPARRVRRRCRR